MDKPVAAQGKARKPRSEKRQTLPPVPLRLTAQQLQQLEEAANNSGLTRSSYIRAKLFSGPSVRAVRRPPVERQALAQILALLGRLGSNVNQIARVLNFGERHDPKALNRALKEITEMRDALMSALGRRSANENERRAAL